MCRWQLAKGKSAVRAGGPGAQGGWPDVRRLLERLPLLGRPVFVFSLGLVDEARPHYERHPTCSGFTGVSGILSNKPSTLTHRHRPQGGLPHCQS